MSRELFLNNVREVFNSGEVTVDRSIFLVQDSNGEIGACAVGAAIYKIEGMVDILTNHVKKAAELYNLSTKYISGVSSGFHEFSYCEIPTNPEFKAGFDDGKSLWKEFGVN